MSSNDGRPSSPELPSIRVEETDVVVAPVEPVPLPERTDERSLWAWRQWLASMATDAESALAAAIAYRQMEGPDREQWLRALEVDAGHVAVPVVALCAPLLAVETDERRRQSLLSLMEDDAGAAAPRASSRALFGRRSDGTNVYVLSTPLYLDFVQVLACGVRGGRFCMVRHDPIVSFQGVPETGQEFFGARLESAPIKSVLDELALAVLSHQKTGEAIPEALKVLGDLLGPLGP